MREKRLSQSLDMPKGFAYRRDFISVDEERYLLEQVSVLQFKPFSFHGYVGRRRIIEYGLEYDFSAGKAIVAASVPESLTFLNERAAAWAGIDTNEIVEVLITEYSVGAPIGWHRDVPKFEIVIGISLGSSCRLRFKPYSRPGTILWTTLEPRSAYLMRGAARWEFQHSIPATKAVRYSITLRTLRRKQSEGRLLRFSSSSENGQKPSESTS